MYGAKYKIQELFVHDMLVANTFNFLICNFYILDSSICDFARYTTQ